MRRSLTKQSFGNDWLENMQTITQYWLASALIANLFIEISSYNTQTTTNKYISEDSNKLLCYTAHRNTKLIQSEHFFLTRKKETDPAGSRTFQN